MKNTTTWPELKTYYYFSNNIHLCPIKNHEIYFKGIWGHFGKTASDNKTTCLGDATLVAWPLPIRGHGPQLEGPDEQMIWNTVSLGLFLGAPPRRPNGTHPLEPDWKEKHKAVGEGPVTKPWLFMVQPAHTVGSKNIAGSKTLRKLIYFIGC